MKTKSCWYSTSINVESENESTNDYRAGLEFAMLKNKL